jgi:hypothetical protein
MDSGFRIISTVQVPSILWHVNRRSAGTVLQPPRPAVSDGDKAGLGTGRAVGECWLGIFGTGPRLFLMRLRFADTHGHLPANLLNPLSFERLS